MQGQRILTRDLLYQAIRDAVITGELAPGLRVTETTLAERFGMSRTPLREAIARLESEQLVIRQPNGALSIAPLDMGQLAEIYDIQERVEGLVVSTLARMKDAAVVHRLDLVLHTEEGLVELADFHAIAAQDFVFHETLWDASELVQAASILRGFVGLFEWYTRLAPLVEADRGRMRAMHAEHVIIRNAIAEGDSVWAEMALKTHVRNSKRFLLQVYRRGEEGSP
ncbi:MAG: GntR family transcriptional regulator [Alicyclobacillus sp.]|nr:GntR family transcriptional regulator [Alicyclobacillus sp.]